MSKPSKKHSHVSIRLPLEVLDQLERLRRPDEKSSAPVVARLLAERLDTRIRPEVIQCPELRWPTSDFFIDTRVRDGVREWASQCSTRVSYMCYTLLLLSLEAHGEPQRIAR